MNVTTAAIGPKTRHLTALVVCVWMIFGMSTQAMATGNELGMASAHAICKIPQMRDTAERLKNLCPNGLCGLDVIEYAETQIDRGRLLTLTGMPESHTVNVLFRFARSTFTASEVPNYHSARARLDDLVRRYKALGTAKIFVLGRASQVRGTVDRNLVRSRQRMLAIANYVAAAGVADADIHVAYFGASAHQLSLNDLGDLGISEERLGPSGSDDSALTAQLNQSVQAFLWPCAMTPTAPGATCGGNTDAGAGYIPPCRSRLSSTAQHPAHRVLLSAGNAGDLIRHYFEDLDASGIEADLERLQVYFKDTQGKSHAESAPAASLGDWFKGKGVRDLWIEKLAAYQATLTADTPDLGDYICGLYLPVPSDTSPGLSCSATRPGRSRHGWPLASLLVGAMVLGLLRRRKGS